MTDNTQPEALDLADWLEAVGGGPSAKRCAALLREQRFDAADMATAAAQGFRDGVASVSAGSEPADTVVLNAAMRAIQQAIELIGTPTDERMRAVRRVLRGAVIVAEDAGKVAPLPAAPGPADGESK